MGGDMRGIGSHLGARAAPVSLRQGTTWTIEGEIFVTKMRAGYVGGSWCWGEDGPQPLSASTREDLFKKAIYLTVMTHFLFSLPTLRMRLLRHSEHMQVTEANVSWSQASAPNAATDLSHVRVSHGTKCIWLPSLPRLLDLLYHMMADPQASCWVSGRRRWTGTWPPLWLCPACENGLVYICHMCSGACLQRVQMCLDCDDVLVERLEHREQLSTQMRGVAAFEGLG